MNDSPGALQLLSERVDELEIRVRALEHPAEVAFAAHAEEPRLEPATNAEPALETGAIFPLIGRALLGIAGAYVLRAIAETGALPKLPLSAIAVAYAFGWLIWSAQISTTVKRTVYAITSALILAPVLWENTLGFHVFTPSATAGILAAFLTLAILFELRNPGVRGLGVAQAIALLATAALGFTTLRALPFISALLIALAVSEFARAKELPQPLWPLFVLVTDAMLSGLIFIYSGPTEARAAYPTLGTAALIVPPLILFAINVASVAVRLVVHTCRLMIFETFQIMISFGLMSAAVLLFAPAHSAAVIGIICLTLSASSYLCALRYLACRVERRSFHIFSFWSAALLIAGSAEALSFQGAAALLSAAAIAAAYFAKRVETRVLELQGTVFMLSATIMAGLPSYLYSCVAGTPPQSLPLIIPIVSMSAVLVFALDNTPADTVTQRLLRLLIALVPTCTMSALLIHGVLSLTGSFIATGAHHVTFLRTLVLCAVAVVIAFGGARWARAELMQVAWALLAAVGVKMLLDDLRHGHMGLVAASIAIFAVTLMSIPRLVRMGLQLRSRVALKPDSMQNSEIPV